MITCKYPNGLDCVWIASDQKGHIGAFVTAGVGPIPISVLGNEAVSIDEIETDICSLPQISDARLLVQMKRPDDFIEMAQRGFFVYDWRDLHRTREELTNLYELISIPEKPIHIDSLPEQLKMLAIKTSLDNIDFSQEQSLDINSKIKCLAGDF